MLLAIVEVLIVKTAVNEPSGACTTQGNITLGSVVLTWIRVAPTLGADNVTVHVALEFEPSVVGLHISEEITRSCDKLSCTVWKLPL
jgi:hypothetical protein